MFTLEMGGALSDHSRLGSELTCTQEWLPWLSKFRHFLPVLRALPAFSCRWKDWEPNLENAFGAGTCRWVFSPATLARNVLSAVLGTIQLVQHKHEQWTKTTVQSQLLLSPESSWSPQGSCCPLGCPGALSVLPGWVQDVSCRVQHLFCTMGVKLTSRGQKFSFFLSVPREASGAFSEHDTHWLQNAAIPFHPSTSGGVTGDAMAGWGQAQELRTGFES